MSLALLSFAFIVCIVSYKAMKYKITNVFTQKLNINSTFPKYYGLFISSLNLIIIFFFLFVRSIYSIELSDASVIIYLSAICSCIFIIVYLCVAKNIVPIIKIFEYKITAILGLCLMLVFLIVILVFYIIFNYSLDFFSIVPLKNFLFGLQWNPQNEFKETISDSYGFVPIIFGTFMVTSIAVLVALPVGVFAAIFLAEYATPKIRNLIKPIIEVFAGVPTIVYGYFAVVFVSPQLKELGGMFNLNISSESALVTGLVIAIMLMPYIISLVDKAICDVPKNIRDASYALGANREETIINVVVPSAKLGIYNAVILSVSRAIGETMIVVMAAGLGASLNFNVFEPSTTTTVQMVALLTGDQSFGSVKTLAAFALALTLFVLVFFLNILSNMISKR